MQRSYLKYKIYFIFFGVGLFFIAFSLLALNRVYTINLKSTEIEKNWLPSIELIDAINTATSDYRTAQALHILSDSEIEMVTLSKKMQRIAKDIADWRVTYETLISSEEERQIYQEFSENYSSYLKASQQARMVSLSNNQELESSQFKETGKLFDTFSRYLVKLVEINQTGGIKSSQEGNAIFKRSRSIIIFSSVFIVILTTIFMFLLEGWSKSSKTATAAKLFSLKFKIRLTFLGVILIFIAYGGLLLERMEEINQQSIEIEVNWLPSVIAINAIDTATSDYQVAEALHILTTQNSDMEKLEEDMKHIAEDIAHWRGKYEPLISSEEERNIYQAFSQQYIKFKEGSEQAIALSRENKNTEAVTQLKQSSLLFIAVSNNLQKLADLNRVSVIQASHKGDNIYQSSENFIIGGSAFVMMVLIVFALLLEGWTAPQDAIDIVEVNLIKKVGLLKSLTIKVKLRMAFLGTVGLFILFTLFFHILMKNIDDKSTEIKVNWMPSIIAVNAINTATSDYRFAEALHILTVDNIQMTRWAKEMERLAIEITELRVYYEALISSPEERFIYQEFSSQFEEYILASKQAVAFSSNNENEQAANQLKINDALFNSFSHNLTKLVELNQEGGLNASQAGDQIFKESQQISIFVGLFILMMIIIFLILFEKGITLPLQQLTALVQHLARGDVSVNSQFQERYDEIGQMANAVDEVTQTLKMLTSDSLELIEAAQAGILSVRVEAEHHPGEFSKIVTGMNQLLEVLSRPLNEIAQVMQNLALGELSERMKGDYEGELRALKLNVNRSLDTLANLMLELTAVTKRMATGDLTQSLIGNYQGEFSALKANVNQSIVQMSEILKIVSANTENSAVATTQTSEAATHVSAQTSKQMAALEEVAATVEETAASVREVAHSATKGNKLAHETTELAETGGEQLNRLILLIQQVGKQYSRIEQITGEITRIADKTHLLSLNAGLEAMRAGEYGLGFGFVAQQIGKLAEEVTLSARDIGAVITSSAENVRLGVQTAEETHQAMSQITEAAKSSGEMVQGISAAIVQQSIAVQSLAERISDIQSSSESTAAAAEEISQTMGQLAETAQQTSTQVQRFNLSEQNEYAKPRA